MPVWKKCCRNNYDSLRVIARNEAIQTTSLQNLELEINKRLQISCDELVDDENDSDTY